MGQRGKRDTDALFGIVGFEKGKPVSNVPSERQQLASDKWKTLLNYGGPGNTLNKGMPNSMLDSFCMVHGMEYQSKSTSERSHLAITLNGNQLINGLADLDGWTGPTNLKKNHLIHINISAFYVKIFTTESDGIDDNP
jgi:hypothetical protein